MQGPVIVLTGPNSNKKASELSRGNCGREVIWDKFVLGPLGDPH